MSNNSMRPWPSTAYGTRQARLRREDAVKGSVVEWEQRLQAREEMLHSHERLLRQRQSDLEGAELIVIDHMHSQVHSRQSPL